MTKRDKKAFWTRIVCDACADVLNGRYTKEEMAPVLDVAAEALGYDVIYNMKIVQKVRNMK